MSIIDQLSKCRNKVGRQLYEILFTKNPYIYQWQIKNNMIIPEKKFCSAEAMKKFFLKYFKEYEQTINDIWTFHEGHPKGEGGNIFVHKDQVFYYVREMDGMKNINHINQWVRID